MIQRAKFQNFKSLRDVEITFDSRLTVLVGRNGTGKTSVLHCLRLLANATNPTSEPQKLFDDVVKFTNVFSGEENQPLVVEGWQPSRTEAVPFGVRIEAHAPGSLRLATLVNYETMESVDQPDRRRPRFGPAAMPAFDLRRLSQPTHPPLTPSMLEEDGHGLASVLSDLKLSTEEVFEAVQSDFQKVMKRPIKLRLNRVQQGSALADTLMMELPGGARVPAAAMSEGTLYLLGLITLIHSPNRPRLLLLDHLDGTLHPGAQLDLVDLLHRLLDLYTDLQIVATAHSPYILDRLRPEEVRLLSLDTEGHTRCRPLVEHPEFQRWKEPMTPGEFWGTFYEDDPAERHAKLQPAG